MSERANEGTGLPERLASELSRIGVPFRADAWKNKAPDDYGVVEITGQDSGEWADDGMIDQTFWATITLYVTGNNMKWPRLVQARLAKMDAGYKLTERQWLPDIQRTAWTWRASFYAPIEGA